MSQHNKLDVLFAIRIYFKTSIHDLQYSPKRDSIGYRRALAAELMREYTKMSEFDIELCLNLTSFKKSHDQAILEKRRRNHKLISWDDKRELIKLMQS